MAKLTKEQKQIRAEAQQLAQIPNVQELLDANPDAALIRRLHLGIDRAPYDHIVRQFRNRVSGNPQRLVDAIAYLNSEA